VPLFRRLAIPVHPIDLFFWHPQTKKIAVSQLKLGIHVPTFRIGLQLAAERLAPNQRLRRKKKTKEPGKKNKAGILATHRLNSNMKTILLASLFLAAAILPAPAQDRGEDKDNERSSTLTPTAQRPRNMANPEIPGWQAVPHGK